MKKNLTLRLFLFLFISGTLFSCSVNQFAVRKNFQPRIQIDPIIIDPSVEVLNHSSSNVFSDSSSTKTGTTREAPVHIQHKVKPTLLEKIVRKTFPRQQEILDRIFDHQKKRLNKTQDPELDGSQVTGLIIGILAMLFAIASYLMIIVMVNGGLYTGFIVGLVLAAAAIAIGFIGKMLPLRGISIAAGVLGIVAVFVLIAFLVLIIVGVI
jgi:hypothetical protein